MSHLIVALSMNLITAAQLTPLFDYQLLSAVLFTIVGILLLILNYLLKRNKKELRRHQEELTNLHEETLEAERAKDTFLANVSHETRTPMNAIIGLSHIILQSDLNKTQRANISKIKRSAEHLLSITNDILDYSKIEAGKLMIRESSFEPDDLITDLGDMLGFQAHDKNLELLFDIDKKLPTTIMGDQLRISQVLINLLNNAIKFTEKGEVLLKISVKSQEESIYHICFEVKDTGIGLTEEQSSKLFQAFDQADNKISRKYGGTGLGLAISKELVEKMGGQLEVQSRYREGSRFYFTLPLEVPPATKQKITPSNVAKQKKVLILEPNKHSAHLIHKILTEHGAITSVIANIDKLYFYLTKDHYDLLIIDESYLSRLKDIPTVKKEVDAIILLKYEVSDLSDERGLKPQATVIKPYTYKTLLEAFHEIYTYEKVPLKSRESLYTLEDITVLRGSKILMAEDNEGNQMVIEGLLEGSGIEITTVKDGQKAIEAIFNSGKEYELILMDINMPVMDGYVATSIIREYPKYDKIPIIAITANINENDIEKCKTLGMQSHLNKPVDVSHFYKTLLEYIKPKASKQQTVTSTRSEQTPAKLEEIPGLDSTDGLARLNGNLQAYQNVLFKFAEMFTDITTTLTQMMHEENHEEGRAQAHSLKGLAGNIGAKRTYTLAKDLEDAFKNKQGHYTEKIVAIKNELEPLIAGIKQLQQQEHAPDESPKAEVLPQQIRKILEPLLLHAKKRKALDVKKSCQEITNYQWPSEYQKAIHDILTAAQAYQFKIIILRVEEILAAQKGTA